MDEGLPIAYEVLEKGVSVFASGGEEVGSVDHVVAAPQEDIFHGIVVRTDDRTVFVAADQVVALHERGVDLQIDATEVAALPAPHGSAPAWRANEPGVKPSRWRELLDMVSGKPKHGRGWSEED